MITTRELVINLTLIATVSIAYYHIYLAAIHNGAAQVLEPLF
jgi:hypothetical protein